MDDWTEFKKHIRTTNPELAEDLKEVEEFSTKLAKQIKQRQRDDNSQIELSELCTSSLSSFLRR